MINKTLVILLIVVTCMSCEKVFIEAKTSNTPTETYNLLWETLNRNYSYFTYKDINWDSVDAQYRPLINDNMSSKELWGYLSEMLCVLDDGHVNLIDGELWSKRSDCQTTSYKKNFNFDIIKMGYFFNGVKYSGPLLYTTIDSVGYVYYSSFKLDVSEADIDLIIDQFKNMKGIIFDIRDNGGGDSDNAEIIQSRLLSEKTLVEYTYFKKGPGHNDFSEPQKLYISPKGPRQFTKPIAVLINRNSFSSSSFFASRMSVLPHVALIGDTTSGGAGRPKYFDLPNGWAVRYSSDYSLRADGFNFENGVPPDFQVNTGYSDETKLRDSIIDFAVEWIRSGS